MKITELIKEIDVWTEWQHSYARFVPRFISNAIEHTKWQEWDEDVFREFFQRSSGQCVSSIQQKYFDNEEQQSIKDNWAEIAPLLKKVAESQDKPLWDTYIEIKNTIRKYTKENKHTATNRLIASLQPKLLCTIVQEKHLDKLYNLLVEFGVENTPSCKGDWFQKSHTIYRFICDSIENWNPYETSTLSWQIKEYLSEKENKINEDKRTKKIAMEKLISLLHKNKNIILTGAPGTGKTYLAKQIAQQLIFGEAKENLTADEQKRFDEQYSFVQFHPSYDYTDFVEGLRPIQDDNRNVGFKRRNGVFKEFCKKALNKPDKEFVFIIDEINRGEISKIFGELFFSIDPDYRGVEGKVQTQYQNLVDYERDGKGQMLDGDGNVTTDETAAKEDVFRSGFFVPENVYIIGTMNDIDRSVESMDFAFRRRFAFKEIKADESMKMLDDENAWKDEQDNIVKPSTDVLGKLKNRMNNLNNKIWHKAKTDEKEEEKCIDGLSSAYHIGAAYFLKLKNYLGDTDGGFENLWNNHLEGLLREYLRSSLNIEENIAKLKAAYNNELPENNG